VFKDIQAKQMIGYDIKRGKLYYLDLVLKSFDRLHQSLIKDFSEGNKKKVEIWL
jgi:hypothetical protein